MANSFKKTFTLLNNFSKYAQRRNFVLSSTVSNVPASQEDSIIKTPRKIEELANSIAQLNLIEVAELTDLLKKKLNLPDTPMMAYGAPGLAGPSQVKEEEPENVTVQTNFTVKLKSFDEKQKVALIKEIKSLVEGMNLVQAKKFVESAPVAVKENIGKTEAEELKNKLVKAGAEVEIV